MKNSTSNYISSLYSNTHSYFRVTLLATLARFAWLNVREFENYTHYWPYTRKSKQSWTGKEKLWRPIRIEILFQNPERKPLEDPLHFFILSRHSELYLHFDSPRLSIFCWCSFLQVFLKLLELLSLLFHDFWHVETILEEFRDRVEEMSLHTLEQVAFVRVDLERLARKTGYDNFARLMFLVLMNKVIFAQNCTLGAGQRTI